MSPSDMPDETDVKAPSPVQGAASFMKFMTVLQIVADQLAGQAR